VTADDGRVEVFQEPDAAGLATGVGGKLEEVDAVGNRQRAREVGEEDGARLERCDEQRLALGIGGCELLTELDDAAGDLLPGQVDLPDRVAVGREETG
jgi:hypothetical protein